MVSKKFPEKRVFITGAGSGLGRAIALEFAGKGWNICICDINKSRALETSDLVKNKGGHPLVIEGDVTDFSVLEKAAKEIETKWGGLDILVNNAGIAAGGYMEQIPLERWEQIIDINLKSVIYGCKVFIPLLKKQSSGGHIVNVASSAGIVSLPEMASYNLTKAGVISLSETLKIELAPHNIGVTVVAPTFFKTNLMESFSSTNERQRKMAEIFFNNAKSSSEDIARHAILCIRRNRLYAIQQPDGKIAWLFKRFFTESYFNLMAYTYKKKLMEKFMSRLKAKG
jgi:NAD(P)-dependent dehydrogenase (short-subunit alcohol dehydrogenase family)